MMESGERERRRVEGDVRLVAQIALPHHLAGVAVGGDDAAVIARHRYDEIAPQRDAAVAVDLLLAGVHLPYDVPAFAGTDVDLVDHAPGVRHIHEAVVDQRRRREILVAGGAAERHREGEAKVLHVRLVDGVERRKTVGTVVVMVHQPVLRLGIEQALIGHIGGLRRGGANGECRTAGTGRQHTNGPCQNAKSAVHGFLLD